MKRFLKRYLRIHIIFIAFVSFVACANFLSLLKVYNFTLLHNDPQIFKEPGYEFADLKEPLSSVKYVGFLTNKDMSPERNDGQFLKAQYMLAPTILELDNANYPWLILDCTSLIAAFDILQKTDSVPILVNEYEKILAKKKP